MDLGHLREDYQSTGLDEAEVAANPIEQFQTWFGEVADGGLWEPNAMTVSTVDADGAPHSRNVLLKSVDDRGFVFYTNYGSDKGRQLIAHPKVALTFSWIELRRQVRVDGLAEQMSAEESDAYFASRPRGSQIGAWASPQSQVIADRSSLDDEWAALEVRFGEGPVPRPEHWGGFRIRPAMIEFWQGRTNRLHDRIRYRLGERGAWTIDRLAP